MESLGMVRTFLETRVLQGSEFSLEKEIEYIVARAVAGDSRLVCCAPLVLFSTTNGDAWVLDPSDNLALCLAREGHEIPVRIMESEHNFAIEWNRTFRIEDGHFVVTDQDGRSTVMDGYPVGKILQFIDDYDDCDIPF